jgi:two-component system LytT family response regulator
VKPPPPADPAAAPAPQGNPAAALAPLRALVADDEPLARRKLAALLAEVGGVVQVGEAGDGVQAVEAVARLRPDLLFLDIQMPECDGVQVVRQLDGLDHRPVVIFTTAHDRYAIAAFELGAVDYLLKPFGRERFVAAFARARAAVQGRHAAASWERMREALAGLQPAVPQRLFVRDGEAIVPLALQAVQRVEAQDDYVLIHAAGRRHLASLRIAGLEARLPQPPFLRVHRSHLVNLDHVDRLEPLADGRLEVRMRDGARVPVSRARAQSIRRLAR